MPTGREIFFRVRFIYSCKFKIRLAFQPVISEICKVLPISNVSNMNSSIRKCTLVVQALFGFCIIRCVSLLFVIVLDNVIVLFTSDILASTGVSTSCVRASTGDRPD